MSRTLVHLPLIACLLGAEEVIGEGREWKAVDGDLARAGAQTDFLQWSLAPSREVDMLALDEMKHVVAWTADEINAFLAENGFDIELDEFEPESFGVAAILTALIKWATAGSKTTLYAKDESGRERGFPAVEMSGKDVVYLRSSVHAHLVVRIPTTNGDEVFLTILEDHEYDLGEVDFVGAADAILDPSNLVEVNNVHDLIFPMVDLDQEEDISWILGLNTTTSTGQNCKIVQAKQQTKVGMNHEGVKVKSAGAMEFALESIPFKNRIDKPFLLVIRRPGLPVPILVARITQDDWKDPGELDSE